MKIKLVSTLLLFLAVLTTTTAQDFGNFSGGFESNSQWLRPDEGTNFTEPDDPFRSNNYFTLHYTHGKFSAGAQFESYLPQSLLGYSPNLNDNKIATYYLNYKDTMLDVTAGYFYDQFGSGLILRTWEDRQLGINNALRGARVKFTPTPYLDLTGLFGEQRVGFELSEGVVGGIDANLSLDEWINSEDLSLRLGGSYVARYQDNLANQNIPTTVNAFSGRLDVTFKNVFASFEAIHKDEDALVNEGTITNNDELYRGTALLLNIGYATSGFGINTALRRLENFAFYSDRFAEGNQYNQQIINYVPTLTKQHDYMLSNIYVYNTQPRLVLQPIQQQAGEMGAQVDAFYTIKRGSFLGGKYGTKIDFNFSYWGGLDAEYDVANNAYKSEFIGKSARYFREVSVEIRKRWTENLSGIYLFSDLIIDKGITDGSPLGEYDINAQVAVAEHTYRLGNGRSVRLELQHLWTQQDKKNWAAALVEYNFSPRLGIYAGNSWNYGNEDKDIHYYNFGGSYTKGNTRVAVNYGRQRGGLLCVGGVCRFVPENTGFSANLAINF